MHNGLIHGALVLICDGRKAILSTNVGDRTTPNLQVIDAMEHADKSSREQGTDRPGRAFSSADDRRSATEETDFHRLGEERFLGRVAGALAQKVSERRPEQLIVVAPARALGILRKGLVPSVRKILQYEIEKDYVRMPVHVVEQHLLKYLSESTVR